MTSQLVSRFAVAVAFVVPVAVGASVTRQNENVPKETTLTVNPNDDGLVRVSRPVSGGVFEVEGRNVKAIYSPSGLTLRMTDGQLTATVGGQKQGDKFTSIELKFAPNGDMISLRADN